MASGVRPTTDTGTVVLHTLIVASFVVLVLTGARIASDDPASLWLTAFDKWLPMEHLWYRHLVAAVVLMAAIAAYAVYMISARLSVRIRLDRSRVSTALQKGKARWAALNTFVFWALMISIVTEIVTGVTLFYVNDPVSLALHRNAMWSCVGCVGLHVGLHALYGGVAQLARIANPAPLVVAPPKPDFAELLSEQLQARRQEARGSARAVSVDHESRPLRPQSVALADMLARGDSEGCEYPMDGLHRSLAELRDAPRVEDANAHHRSHARLPKSPPTTKIGRVNAHPLATAAAAAFAVSVFAVEMESQTRQVLHIPAISPQEAPQLDGDISDPIWSKVPPVTVATSQGGDFGGSGASEVQVRAVHDGTNAYFAFVWNDPTRSLKHQPLIKTASGWELMAPRGDAVAAGSFNEDKFAVLLARPSFPLIGAAIHLSPVPLGDKPASRTGRGMHYTLDGSVADVWVWRASQHGRGDFIDNGHFAGAAPPLDAAKSAATYQGGFAIDSGAPIAYAANFVDKPASSTATILVPRRLPKNIALLDRHLGRVSDASGQSDAEDTLWTMTTAESVPFSAAADAKFPVGTIIPGVILGDVNTKVSNLVSGAARWAGGRWTLEISRKLYTGSEQDLPIKSGQLLWIAAFDHSETRHTRHLRPLRLEVD